MKMIAPAAAPAIAAIGTPLFVVPRSGFDKVPLPPSPEVLVEVAPGVEYLPVAVA